MNNNNRGAAVGSVVGIFLKHPRFWSYFFAGIGAHHAYSKGPVKLHIFRCDNC
ncbi:hypothetical protein IMG5_020540 [Ichthyophthirius multifiliis]|uniref:Uncharacterized protein n=1 Tax=Ichthyophthirius multifiliis TaxID=5932 RepID=G0QKP5_ICHMU|nr:hypothetical protein IMG5_020540 [Ichthyophthirius multifiliis]EGR34199.1 hypothetical protein IMG5_020540 [Ichthyophthirius multifiliis]|eukprot:XP_004039503.1 hypothetical protein IMG5_020540 [Ichthyophthirius multifiliis]